MAIKIPMIVTIIMMKLVKGTHNNTQRQNNAHPKHSHIAADQCNNVTRYLYLYYDIEKPKLYSWNIHLKPGRKE